MNDLTRDIVREMVAILIPILVAWLIAQVTGLVGRLQRWLEAKQHASLSAAVGTANVAFQYAAENYAGLMQGAIRRGELDPTDVSSVKRWALGAEDEIRRKMPGFEATATPKTGSIADMIEGKAEKRTPPVVVAPIPVSAPPAVAGPASATVLPGPAPDRRQFFDAVRSFVFGGKLVQSQVDGCNKMLDHWGATTPNGDVRHLAYILATAVWETGRTMQPIEEYGRGSGRFYGPTGFFGRGLVQITLKPNYEAMSPIAGCDLVAHPERALEWPIALRVLFIGMTNGMFTGKKLADFFNAERDDPVGARAIVNGTDRADEIATIYRAFLAALQSVDADRKMAA